jgi:hypothetical protein
VPKKRPSVRENREMYLLREIIMTLQEKIDLSEKESNDIEKIEQEKRQFNALQDWSKKPRYQMPETILERAKRWLRDVFMDRCECGGTYYDWSSKKSVCDKCGRIKQ